MSDPDNTGRKQGRGQFKPGQSGNPRGKAPGTRHRVTRAIEALLEGEHEKLTRKAIEMALSGDGPALRLCLERLAPVRKDAPIAIDLPPVKSAADAVGASATVLAAVAAGDITPGEAGAVMTLLTAHKSIIEVGDLAARVAALEAKENGK